MTITPIRGKANANIILDGSKSESNRALMIKYYGALSSEIDNLSHSADTMLLNNLLALVDKKHDCVTVIDCANAGTVLRFMLTALTMKDGRWLLTGDERMCHRPIGPLVEALRSIGASVTYRDNDGFPPLIVEGAVINGGNVTVDTDCSSQFASSLLLAAPLMQNGLHVHLTGNLSSMPYIDMTIKMMNSFGVNAVRDGLNITVPHSKYSNVDYVVNPDWSSAAFWYEIIAIHGDATVMLENLDMSSPQGDMAVADFFQQLGVNTICGENGVLLERNEMDVKKIHYDFLNTPDLFPPIAATCAALKVDAVFTGIENVTIKESDRLSAMTTELKKIGADFELLSKDILIMKSPETLPVFEPDNPLKFNTYQDHRIAMALTPLCFMINAVQIDSHNIVEKSYPLFWEDLSKNKFINISDL